MNTNTPSMELAQIAADRWNAGADEYNQWDALGQDEKDELISAEQKLLVSPGNDDGNPHPPPNSTEMEPEHGIKTLDSGAVSGWYVECGW